MYPTLLIGPVALPTYPLFLLAGLWVGMWLSARRAGHLEIEGDHIYNAGLYGLLAGIIGARVWFVLSHWENYAGNLAQAFSLSRSALSTGEGLVIAGLAILIYLQRNTVPLGRFFDAVAPGLAVALAIGHTGAFLGGQAPGLSSNVPWAVEIAGATRHPVQLYFAVAALAGFAVLYAYRHFRPWSGFQFWLLVALYAAARLVLEIFQARPAIIGNGYLAGQILALAAIVVALAVMAYNFTGKAIH